MKKIFTLLLLIVSFSTLIGQVPPTEYMFVVEVYNFETKVYDVHTTVYPEEYIAKEFQRNYLWELTDDMQADSNNAKEPKEKSRFKELRQLVSLNLTGFPNGSPVVKITRVTKYWSKQH